MKSKNNWLGEDGDNWDDLLRSKIKLPKERKIVKNRRAEGLIIDDLLNEKPNDTGYSRRPNRYKKSISKPESKTLHLNLNISLPRLKTANIKRFYATHHKKFIQMAVVLVLAFGVFVGVRLFARSDGKDTKNITTKAEAAKKDPLGQAKLAFTPLIPLSNLKDATGTRVAADYRYDEKKKLLAFSNNYNNAKLTVSQQKVPSDFKSNPAKLLSIADSANADKHIETQKGTVYISTDEKTTAQTAIFATDSVLMFIRSDKAMLDDEWQLFINQLNPAE